jgi:acyl-CoA dehydrogenase
MYGLSEEDLALQARAREFADELIPFEGQAELAGGDLPADVTAAHAKRARELGLHSTNMPAELGGGGCSSLQQVLVQEQAGRVTNALGWVAATPPSWLPGVATADQLERYVRPAISGEREECYAIAEDLDGAVFGGRGYMRENVAERFYRELRVERIWEGTSEIQRMIIARQMTKRGPVALA